MENQPSKNYCPYTIPTIDEIVKDIYAISGRYSVSKLLTDTFECGAIAISNMVDRPQRDAREDRYKEIMAAYNEKERKSIAAVFGKVYALLSSVVFDDGEFNDYLGRIFMGCNMGNKHAGQFFTPYHVSRLCAELSIGSSVQTNEDEILTINDPCCGSGGMMIAALDVLKNKYNINYTHKCYIECSDIDLRCVHMAYLQLSLAGVPAVIKHQDSLTLDTWSIWKTPALIMQYWRFRRYIG